MAFGKDKPAKADKPPMVNPIDAVRQRSEDGPYRVKAVSTFNSDKAEFPLNDTLNMAHRSGYKLISHTTVQAAGPTIMHYLTFEKKEQ